MLEIRPITLKDANIYVSQHHRHNMPTNGHKFSIACYEIFEGGVEKDCVELLLQDNQLQGILTMD